MSQTVRPNVIMLVSDDHQAGAMGWCGNPDVKTPVLDGLATRGAAFSRAYHMGGKDDALCIPSRACLLTGLDFSAALPNARGVLNPECITLPEHFKQADYHSYAIGKWHNDKASLTRSFSDGAALFLGGMCDHYQIPVRPFDPQGVFSDQDVIVSNTFSQDLFCEEACSFIKNYKEEKPFFLYAAFTAPHDPRTPPSESMKDYDPDNISLPPNFMPEHPFDLGVRNLRDEELGPYPRSAAFMREDLANYYGMITALDQGVGRILESLDASGQLENTIVVYTGDHGLAMGQHGLLGKQNMYEHSMRVPLILSGPGIKQAVYDHPVYARDLYATLCDLCALAVPETIDAQNLFHKGRDQITGLYMDTQRMICQGEWKLIVVHSGDVSRVQLYNLEDDPYERINLAEDHKYCSKRQELLAALQQSDVGLPQGFLEG